MVNPLSRYRTIACLITYALLAGACVSRDPSGVDLQLVVPELDPGLHLVTEVHESLVRISHEHLEGSTYRDTWEVTGAGRQRILNGSTLDFVVSIFLELSNSSFRVQLPGSEEWATLFDFENSLPRTMVGGAVYFWSVWDRDNLPSAVSALDDVQLTIEYSNASPQAIRVVDVRSELLGPVLPMNVVYCAGTPEDRVVQVRWPNQLRVYENGIVQSEHAGGSIQSFTIANGYAWWLHTAPEDVQSLHWVNLITGESAMKSGFPSPMAGVAGLDTMLMIGTASDTSWISRKIHRYSIPQILSGSSLSAALVDSVSFDSGIILWGSLPLSHQVYGITDQDMSGGLRELQIGIWDTAAEDITKATVPFAAESLLGLVETQSSYFVGTKRLLSQAIGLENAGVVEFSIEPRFFRYPFQLQSVLKNH